MTKSLKRILPILLAIVVILSIFWYLFDYDRDFTQNMLLQSARYFESRGNHSTAAWFYNLAYDYSGDDADVAIELAERFKAIGSYTKAEHTLSRAIARHPNVDLYIALCKTYVEQDKLLDAVTMLENVSDPQIKEQLNALRPAAPTASPAPGFHSEYITVSITADNGTLYTSTDGEYPSVHKDLYGGGITLVGGENTIRAIAVAENGLVSPMSILGYIVGGVIEEVELADSTLEALLREKLGKGEDDVIMTNELWNITTLDMPAGVKTFSDLKFLPYLTELSINGGSFENLNVLSSLSHLTKLTIKDSILSSVDVKAIAGLPHLTTLTLSGCSLIRVDALSEATNLVYLDLSDNTIRQIDALASLPKLEYLSLHKNAISELAPLSGVTTLKYLDISNNSITSLEPLTTLVSLEQLNAGNNFLEDLTGLAGMTSLKKLILDQNKFSSIKVLSGLTTIEYLSFEGNTVSDLSPLVSLTKMYHVNFAYNKVTNLPKFKTSCALVYINGAHNTIKSVTNLGGLQNLNDVVLSYNKITNIDALAKCHHLISVDVYGNKIKDVSKLTDMDVVVRYSPA